MFVFALQGIISGITAIVLSKNKKNRILVNTTALALHWHGFSLLRSPVRTCTFFFFLNEYMCVEVQKWIISNATRTPRIHSNTGTILDFHVTPSTLYTSLLHLLYIEKQVIFWRMTLRVISLHLTTFSCHVVLAAVGLAGHQLPGGSPGGCLHRGLVSFCDQGYHEQRMEPANTLHASCRLLFQHHIRMPLWPHPDLCKLDIIIYPLAVWILTWIDAKKGAIRVFSPSVLSTGDHNHPVGASHLDVHSGNGVLLPLLCCLYFFPLPLSVQEEAVPG